jgi:hypothetical protein
MPQHSLHVGMTVRDQAGQRLGTIRRVHPWGFEVKRGFWSPYEWVFRHDEVVTSQDGVVEVARRADDLQRLAAGELPESWRRHTPPFATQAIPSAPGEYGVVESGLGPVDTTARPLGRDEEREFMRTRGQPKPSGAPPGADAPAHS